MKKILPQVLALLFLFCFASSCLGNTSWRTYEVVAISDNSLTLVDSDGTQIEVNKDPRDYKVGYKVRYDNVKKVLMNDYWQDYTVREVTASSITLDHKTGDTLTLESGELITDIGKFKKGDAVRYDWVRKDLRLTE